MKKYFITFLFVAVAINSFAQYFKGDSLPNLELGSYMYKQNKKAHLSDFNGQFLLMDIMSINCSSCLKALPKYDSMQAILQTKAKLLIIVTNPEKQARDFFNKRGYNKLKNLTFIAAGEELKNSFNINTTPFHVWLSANRNVQAITNADYVTLQNIKERLLSRQPATWADISIPPYEPLFTKEQVDNSPAKPVYYSLFQGYLQGLKTKRSFSVDSVNQCQYWDLTNFTIRSLYSIALIGLDQPDLIGQRFKIETKNKASLFFNPDKDYHDAWNRKNNFSFSYRLPWNTTPQQRSAKLLADLNLYLGLNGRIEKQELSCLIIQASKERVVSALPNNRIPVPRKEIKFSLKEVVELLNYSGHPEVFLLNYPSPKEEIIISSEAFQDISKLVIELNNQGFSITPRQTILAVFVLSE